MKILKRTILILIATFTLFALFVFGWFFAVTRGVALDEEKLRFHQDSMQVFDCFDENIPLPGDKKGDFSISSLPKKVQLAFVDTEDKRFYSHHGFDYKRMAKAFLVNLKTRSFTQGASTISQQLIKNTHLSHEKTLTRKAREIKLTKALEKRYKKEEILEKYLNSIYFGHNCFGITSAAEFYFGKSPKELTLAEGSVLAGLVRSPNHYSPFRNQQKCRERQTIVLRAMLGQKHITNEEFVEAQNSPLPLAPTVHTGEKSYLFETFFELDKLAEKNGFSLRGKTKIYTYFSPLQEEKIKRSVADIPTDKTIVIQDNATGGITAFYSTIQNAKRMTGSIIKPLLVYAPALEEGVISPCTPILDERTDFGGYIPHNYGNEYFGYVSATKALSKSLNVPAVKILSATGVEKSKQYTKKMGLSIEENHLALALGGMKDTFSLTDLISAYSTFSRGGEFVEGHFIKRVEVNGKTVYTAPQKGVRVFSEGTAFLISDMLKETTRTGTGKKLASIPFPLATKTGTNGKGEDNFDAYAISYTTKDTFGIWLGNADNTPIPYTGGGKCAEILNDLLGDFYQENPPDFACPNTVKKVKIDKIEYDTAHGIQLADELAPNGYVFEGYFLEKYLPKRRSNRFSAPMISAPSYSFIGGVFTIDSSTLPHYYTYAVYRQDSSGEKRLVYEGHWKESITDVPPANSSCVYSITPIFQEKKGETLSFPAILTKSGEQISPDEIPDIVYDEWWEK